MCQTPAVPLAVGCKSTVTEAAGAAAAVLARAADRDREDNLGVDTRRDRRGIRQLGLLADPGKAVEDKAEAGMHRTG